jgi:hypothetical protein
MALKDVVGAEVEAVMELVELAHVPELTEKKKDPFKVC